MKVMCISGVKIGKLSTNKEYFAEKQDEIYEGEIYNVIEVVINNNKEYYRLKEKPYHSIYSVKSFIPISNIDEKELIKERELVNA